MHILRLLLWYFSTAGRSNLATSEPTENFSLTWCWMTPGMTRSCPHFFFLYRSSKTVVPDSWHDCIRKICFWPAGGIWGRTWCSSAAQWRTAESEVLIRFTDNSFIRSLNLLASAFSEFSGKTWSAKRAQKIRKTGAKKAANGRNFKKCSYEFCSETRFALKVVLSKCLLWKFASGPCLVLCVQFCLCAARFLPAINWYIAACHDKNTQGSAKGPSLAKLFFRSMVLLGCLTIPAACMASASQWRMSQECCMHVTWMLHACPMNVACCMSGAFCIHACRTHGMFHAWTAVAFLHACMYGPVFCMHEHGCMHADAKIVQLLPSSVPHVWTKRCVASPFLKGVPRFEKMSRLWNFCADDNTLS